MQYNNIIYFYFISAPDSNSLTVGIIVIIVIIVIVLVLVIIARAKGMLCFAGKISMLSQQFVWNSLLFSLRILQTPLLSTVSCFILFCDELFPIMHISQTSCTISNQSINWTDFLLDVTQTFTIFNQSTLFSPVHFWKKIFSFKIKEMSQKMLLNKLHA